MGGEDNAQLQVMVLNLQYQALWLLPGIDENRPAFLHAPYQVSIRLKRTGDERLDLHVLYLAEEQLLKALDLFFERMGIEEPFRYRDRTQQRVRIRRRESEADDLMPIAHL